MDEPNNASTPAPKTTLREMDDAIIMTAIASRIGTPNLKGKLVAKTDRTTIRFGNMIVHPQVYVKPVKKCLLPGCPVMTDHNGGYCCADHCKGHQMVWCKLK